MWDEPGDDDYAFGEAGGCSHPSTCSEGGRTVCRLCGFVLDSNQLSLEVTFESSGPGASAVGRYIPTAGRRNRAIAGVTSESREATKQKARMELMGLASGLSLQPYQVECAVRVYERCLDHRCITGRRSTTVLSACMYIVCRQQKKPQMLIDFSEYYKESVWAISAVFLDVCRTLGLTIPPTDPSLYIERFVERLQIGSRPESRRLAETALKIVARMQRDWLQCGRRPAGIVAAALIVACRVHGCPRRCDDVVRLVRLHEDTLRRRLMEIGATSCGRLTVAHITPATAAPTEAEDPRPAMPPAFRRALESERRETAAAASQAPVADKQAEPAVSSKKRGSGRPARRGQKRALPADPDAEEATAVGPPPATADTPQLLTASHDSLGSPVPPPTAPLPTSAPPQPETQPADFFEEFGAAEKDPALEEEEENWERVGGDPEINDDAILATEGLLQLPAVQALEFLAQDFTESEARAAATPKPASRPVVVEEGLDMEGLYQDLALEPAPVGTDETLSDISGDDVERHLVTDAEELARRAELWDALHSTFVADRATRREQREAERAARGGGGRRRGVKRRDENEITAHDSAVTATLKALRKRSSSNLNYTVLEGLLGDSVAGMNEEDAAAGPTDPWEEDKAVSEVDYGDQMTYMDPLDDFAGQGL